MINCDIVHISTAFATVRRVNLEKFLLPLLSPAVHPGAGDNSAYVGAFWRFDFSVGMIRVKGEQVGAFRGYL
ncbi:hypothetical protein C4F51_10275 [Cellvibrio sp. KB43]|uniref:Uncharacterized protein n=1 Tax=Cellvibrio polysaccharolyticus TaxID=2082724 RepID=A0A928V5H7_9GAMM|nr:hypothetical protein [Cellvibrio polysaccharolyticus]